MSRLNPIESSPAELAPEIELDPIFKNQIDNLYRLNLYGRWAVIALTWFTIGLYSLWELRYPISLIQEDFTWAAVKYGLIFNLVPAIGLCLCVGMMTGTLVWQSRNIIWGLPKKEQQRLIQQVGNIRKQGSSHPLWKWVVKSIDN
ncbi:hypothetical protein [Chamaesiphon sp. VAR_48_metabat_135_sub]|uniref:hypothetical protein n=1 Tax=Chamaesiphon sp. VAR_48_metabat_135_sub TaxID=2964699 RepID=UPI00286C2650|nr:hypothetical protein [Chamaesiphon sp. VAR_48_metabat_135_sub]